MQTQMRSTPIVVMLLPRENGGRQVVLGACFDTTSAWACLPLMAEVEGFTRDATLGNVYHRDGRSYVGTWRNVANAWEDVLCTPPSWYATSQHYRGCLGHARRRTLDAIAQLRVAGELR